MVLDSEEQRTLLLDIVNSIPISGNRSDVKKMVMAFDALVNSIRAATIGQAEPEKKSVEVVSGG